MLGSSEARPTSGRARNKQGHTMTTKIHTETVTTHELIEGDVVHCHGLRVKLGPVFQTRHPITNGGGATYASKAEVLNNEYLNTDAGRSLFGGVLFVGETWTVQGNGWAQWTREVAEPAADMSEAESLARVTGSVAATVTHERREADGSLTVESVETWKRDAINKRIDATIAAWVAGRDA